MLRLDDLLLSVAIGLAVVPVSLAASEVVDEALPDKVTIKAGYFDNDFKPLSDTTLPSTVPFRVRLIPGSLSGPVDDTTALFEFPLTMGESKTLDLAEVRPTLKRLAARLTSEGANAGLVVTPSSTRFARFATDVAYPGTDRGIGGTTFHGSRPNETLLMVYFDRRCQVVGVFHGRTAIVTYNVNIAQPGVHLLSLVRESPTSVQVNVTALPLPLILSVVPSTVGRR